MSLSDWIAQSRSHLSEHQIHVGIKKSVFQLYTGFLRRVARIAVSPGTPIYKHDWDVLIVLDACRYDLMSEFISESDYDFNIKRRRSVGSNSAEWMEKNFNTNRFATQMSQTAYVTGNLYTQKKINGSMFAHIDEVWRDKWDDDRGTVLPMDITLRAAWAERNCDYDYLIVHYMQPHQPFINKPIGEGMRDIGESQRDAWDYLKEGHVSTNELWKRYKRNLENVFESALNLVADIKGRVVITADHGNLIGEYGLYGHPGHTRLPPLVDVPWIEMTGDGKRSLDTVQPQENYRVDNMSDRLAALGYK